MDKKYTKLRKSLDALSYYETLSFESVPLVEKLVEDLKSTTESLQKYKKLAQNAIEEKDHLELSLEPYKADNAKLSRERNELHANFLNYRSQTETELRELRDRVLKLTEENRNLVFENDKLRIGLRETEFDLMKAANSTTGKRSILSNKGGQKFMKNRSEEDIMRENEQIRQELDTLKKELKFFQNKCLNLDHCDGYSSTEEHIKPKKNVSVDYRYCEQEILRLQAEVYDLKREKNELDKIYKETLTRQHEAMKRAIHLAERNKELEKEMKEIDQMAIAVEKECNDAVKAKTDKLSQTEMALNEALNEIQTLEKTIASLRKEKKDMETDNEIMRNEKKRMQTLAEDAVKEKKIISDRFNTLKKIEHDLNMEIDKLRQENASQKRALAEMESKLIMVQASMGPGGDGIIVAPAFVKADQPKPVECPCTCCHPKKPLSTCICVGDSRVKCCLEKDTLTDAFVNGCCDNMCIKHFHQLMTKEIEDCQAEIKNTLARVTKERDHFMNEYHKLVNQMCKLQSKSQSDVCCPTCCKMQQVITFLQQENSMLSKEKMNLIVSLEQTRNEDNILGKCDKSTCRRLLRERDLFKSDVDRLEEECDGLRENIKTICEVKTREHDMFTQQIQEYERRLKRVEGERGELLSCQCTKAAQIHSLQETNECLTRLLKTCQEDLKQQKILNNQLTDLLEQTDKALRDTRAQLTEVEKELASANRMLEASSKKSPQKNERCTCADNIDLNTMKRQLNKMDREKDELLNAVDSKTEEIAHLRNNLQCKCDIINSLTSENDALKCKMGTLSDRATSSGRFLKDAENEVNRLQKLLDSAVKTRDNALEINRKLENELADVCREANSIRLQLTKSQEEIENMKMQSKQYISEVKRAEDLLNSKEKEREELLSQFKQLCEQTNSLQSSKSALENEATQSKVQLSVAMDHVNNLEEKGETLEILISDYEKQISILTNRIAKLESERNQHEIHQERTEVEMKTMRDLCVKLDKEKEQLRFKLLDRENSYGKIDELQRRNDTLASKLTESTTKLQNAESLLNQARQEGFEMRLKNDDDKQEIAHLRKRISELEKKLDTAQKEVDGYQEKALEYSNQLRQLRRELTNNRFRKSSREDDDRYPSI